MEKNRYQSPTLKKLTAQQARSFQDGLGQGRRLFSARAEALAQASRIESSPESWRRLPAWLIIIELYRGYLQLERVTVKDVQIASNTSSGTLHRHLTRLTEEGWIEKRASLSDKRVVYLNLTKSALNVLDCWADIRCAQYEAIELQIA